jgi:hypothetical protein
MKRKILLLTLIMLCSAQTLAVDDSITKKASEYKGFDELIDSITEVQYHNRTYYIATYTKTLMPSGSILLDGASGPVGDLETLKLFTQAEIIHKNYPAESVGQWVQFSDYFFAMSNAFSKSDPKVSQDSRRIGELLSNSALYLNGSISYLSPEYTQKYMEYDREAMDQMAQAYERTPADSKTPYMGEYRESLKNIGRILSDNAKGLETGGTYMSTLMHERVLSEKNRTTADSYTVGATIAVLLFVFLVVKRSNKKQGV